MRKKRILYIIDSLDAVGGMEKHLAQVIEALRFAMAISVVTFKLSENEVTKRLARMRIPLYCIEYNRAMSLKGVRGGYRLYKLLRRIRPDIVETLHHSADTFGVLIARLAGVKRIVSNKRDLADLKTAVEKYASRFTNHWISHFLAVCSNVATSTSRDERISPDRFRVIYNGIDATENGYCAIEARNHLLEKYELKNDTVILCCVANLRPEKGIQYLLRSMGILVGEGATRIHLFIIGNGPFEDALKADAKELELESNVTFTGFVADVKSYVSGADICCLPSIANEGLSNAVLEAMAMAKPVIVTNIGGNAEAVRNGIDGYVVAPKNSASLARRIMRLAENQPSRVKMGHSAQTRALHDFSEAKMINELEEFYSNLLTR